MSPTLEQVSHSGLCGIGSSAFKVLRSTRQRETFRDVTNRNFSFEIDEASNVVPDAGPFLKPEIKWQSKSTGKPIRYLKCTWFNPDVSNLYGDLRLSRRKGPRRRQPFESEQATRDGVIDPDLCTVDSRLCRSETCFRVGETCHNSLGRCDREWLNNALDSTSSSIPHVPPN